MVTRREVLSGLAAVAVFGFSPAERTWVSIAHAGAPVDGAPPLDGELLTDPTSLSAYAVDVGNMVHKTPVAVLKPGSVRDIQKMVRFCRRHGIKVAARGQGHTTFGQSQVQGGLVIDMNTLNQIHTIDATAAEVDAGVKWRDLVAECVGQGLTPPVLTGYINLTIGGTLSVGGISSTNAEGAQVDRVREIEVVTGRGDVERCSRWHNRELFDMALAGLGQCGIITRAVVDLVPAKAMARVFLLYYADNAAFFRDMRTLLHRGEFDDVFCIWLPDGNGGLVYQLNAVKFFDPGQPPNDARLLRGLSADPSLTTVSDSTYHDYVLRVDRAIEFFQGLGLWDGVQHPWYDVFLPSWSVEDYVGEVIPSLTPEDVGLTGFVLLFPQRASKLTRPLFRVPRSHDWVFLFDILTAAAAPGVDPAFEAQMIARNRTLFEKARRVGGTRYPIGTLEFSRLDWILHYGEQWPRLAFLKRHFDPDNILAPGPGIFS